jgi:uncharacterized protein YeaO (DUF488 family)
VTKPAFPASHLRVKRAYEPAAADDGTRLLVDRLWPRGLSRDKAEVSDWLKDIAPSTALRQWFGHDPERWPDFQRRYEAELQQHSSELDRIRALAKKQTVTLVYGAHDELHNNAVALRNFLLRGKADGVAKQKD